MLPATSHCKSCCKSHWEHPACLSPGCAPTALLPPAIFMRAVIPYHLCFGARAAQKWGLRCRFLGLEDNSSPWSAAVLAEVLLLLLDALPFREQNKGRPRRVAGSPPARPISPLSSVPLWLPESPFAALLFKLMRRHFAFVFPHGRNASLASRSSAGSSSLAAAPPVPAPLHHLPAFSQG